MICVSLRNRRGAWDFPGTSREVRVSPEGTFHVCPRSRKMKYSNGYKYGCPYKYSAEIHTMQIFPLQSSAEIGKYFRRISAGIRIIRAWIS